jgi:hypothetical protein
MSLPDDVLSNSPRSSRIVSSKGEDGSPREVQWQEYIKALEPVHPRTAQDAANRAAKRRADASRRSAAAAAAGAAGVASLLSSKGPVITEKELKAAHDKIRNHFATRFTEVRRGFRLLDEDHSGRLDRTELKAVLMMFNLDIKAHLLEKIIDIADADGSGDIDYAEFAQYETPDPNPTPEPSPHPDPDRDPPPPPLPHSHPTPHQDHDSREYPGLKPRRQRQELRRPPGGSRQARGRPHHPCRRQPQRGPVRAAMPQGAGAAHVDLPCALTAQH